MDQDSTIMTKISRILIQRAQSSAPIIASLAIAFGASSYIHADENRAVSSHLCEVTQIMFSNPGFSDWEMSDATNELWYIGINTCDGILGETAELCGAHLHGNKSIEQNTFLSSSGVGLILDQTGTGIVDSDRLYVTSFIGLTLSIDLQDGTLLFGSEMTAVREEIAETKSNYGGVSGVGKCQSLRKIG